MEVVEEIPREKRKILMECLRYFYEVYEFLEGDE